MGILKSFFRKILLKPQEERLDKKTDLNNCGRNNTAEQTDNKISKLELEKAINTLSNMSYIFLSSDRLVGGRNETMKRHIFSYICILGYFYEEEYHYGKVSEIVDSNIATHYLLIQSAMLDEAHKGKTIKGLADNWSEVLQVIANLQVYDNVAGNKLKVLESDIQKVTNIFEKLSGSKCRTPKSPSKQLENEAKYRRMIENAKYNPFKITFQPSLQNNPALPNLQDIFKSELKQALSNPKVIQVLGEKQAIKSYVFNMAESYFNNAGYLPQNTLDEIIRQIYNASSQLGSTEFSSLEEFKYEVYYMLLNR